MKEKIYSKKSKVQGLGLFASSDINKGEIICLMRGKKMSIPQVKKMYESGKERLDDPLQIGDKKYLNLKKPYVYANHSCSPNAGIKGINTLVALKKIKKDQEITYDYSSTEWSNYRAWGQKYSWDWEMTCNCGSKNCRKKIGEFTTLPNKTKMKYYKSGVLQDFIIKKLEASKK